MRHRHRRGGDAPSFIDPAFAEALTASGSKRNDFSRIDYKTKQLCRQVQRALHLALAGELGDSLLCELTVVDVTAPGGAGHLLVHISVPPQMSVATALQRLTQATPQLRALVAQAITRKRAPQLSFLPLHYEEHGHGA